MDLKKGVVHEIVVKEEHIGNSMMVSYKVNVVYNVLHL